MSDAIVINVHLHIKKIIVAEVGRIDDRFVKGIEASFGEFHTRLHRKTH